jgi:hypothetical protein
LESHWNDLSPLRRFVTAARRFGLNVAIRVAHSKVRGRLFPALALPDDPVYHHAPRELSILIGAAEQDAATLEAVVQVIAEQGGSDWEVCVSGRPAMGPELGRALSRLRGAKPWIRVVLADGSVDDVTAAQWTVEQATGEFVAFVAPGYIFDADAIAQLLNRLRGEPRMEAAMLVGRVSGSGALAVQPQFSDCCLLVQKKSRYLAMSAGRWPLTAAALAKTLDEAGAPIAVVAPRRTEMD